MRSINRLPDADLQPWRKRKRSSRPSTVGDGRPERGVTTVSRPRPATASLAIESYGPKAAAPKGMTEWRHPVNGRLFHIDLRTGHSVAIGNGSTVGSKDSLASALVTSPCAKRTSFRGLDLTPAHRKTAVADDTGSVDEFDDPTLDAALAAIPSPTSTAPPDIQAHFFDALRTCCSLPESVHDKYVCATLPQTTTLELAITRSALQQANVLDQVDGKFILCCTASTPSDSDPVLFCVDQHAADERYRLERLLERYVDDCIAGTAAHSLPSSLTLTITIEQQALIRGNPDVAAGLKSMGWLVKDAVLVHATLGHAQVDLGGIPYILKGKTLTDRGSVKDISLLEKTFAECLDEATSWACAVAKWADWLTLTRFMPSSLLNVVKSIACRSAIMFNDPLSREASERLVRRLGGCRFPFQCAHGRPSLVHLCGVRTVHQREEDLGADTGGLTTILDLP